MCLKNVLVYNHKFSSSSFLSLCKVQLCSQQIGLQIKWIILNENYDCLLTMVSKCYAITMQFIRVLMRWPRQVQFQSLLCERNSPPWLWKVSTNHLRRLKLPPERYIGSQCCKQQISVGALCFNIVSKSLTFERLERHTASTMLTALKIQRDCGAYLFTPYIGVVCLFNITASQLYRESERFVKAGEFFRFSINPVEILWTDFREHSLPPFQSSLGTNNIYLFRRLWKQDSVVANDSDRVTKYSWKSWTGTYWK